MCNYIITFIFTAVRKDFFQIWNKLKNIEIVPIFPYTVKTSLINRQNYEKKTKTKTNLEFHLLIAANICPFKDLQKATSLLYMNNARFHVGSAKTIITKTFFSPLKMNHQMQFW